MYCTEHVRVRTRRKLFSSVEAEEDEEVEAMRSLLARVPPLRGASSSTESFGLASAAPAPEREPEADGRPAEGGAAGEFSLPIARRRAAFFEEPFADETDLGDEEADLGDGSTGGGASSSLAL